MHAFGFDNTYARDLPQAAIAWQPAAAPAPRLLYLNESLAAGLGLDPTLLRGDTGAALFAGNALPPDAQPIAQAYAGHQFGGFSPQLGDGRALLLGELIDTAGQRRDIAFKGSGRTPFSRGGDGKAAVGPMLREVLIGEAMHALGIPTTRALAVAATGEAVHRDGGALPGAVLTRVAASHLRVGTFQYFAARGDHDNLRRLTDYALQRHDAELMGLPDRELALLRAVLRRQARLIAQWMNVGFIHGVMNTDNMTLSGETIDYGPCAFMEAFDPQAKFSSIDHGGRYAYANQPPIALWNLARLAEALLPLIADPDDEASVQRAIGQVTEVLDTYRPMYAADLLAGQRRKLGLAQATAADDDGDAALAGDWLELLHAQSVDFTLGWRHLADAAVAAEPGPPVHRGDTALRTLFADGAALDAWLARWHDRCARDDAASAAPAANAAGRAARMRQANPRIIARNHQVESALAAATAGDLQPFEQLLAAVQQPFDDAAALAAYAEPAPAAVTACYRTFCGT